MTEKSKKQEKQEPIVKNAVKPKSKPSKPIIESGIYIGPLSIRDRLILRASLTYLKQGIQTKKEEIGYGRLRIDMDHDLIFAGEQEVDILLQKLSNS